MQINNWEPPGIIETNESIEQLKVQIDQLHNILDNCYDEIFVVNNKGVVIYVNEACVRNYGLKPNEIIEQSIFQLLHDGYYFPELAPIVLQEKKRITIEQHTITGKKLIVTATPIFNDNNELELIVMNGRDMTELESLKSDLEKTKNRVEHYKKEIEKL
ncbi:MAG: PAS domain-containing protein, partial [Bacillota bacterium]|nr:PAS domain-containing protein [Bacillota bacterium]